MTVFMLAGNGSVPVERKGGNVCVGGNHKLQKLMLEEDCSAECSYSSLRNIHACFPAFCSVDCIKEHPKAHHSFAASLGNNEEHSYCMISLRLREEELTLFDAQ